jgi:hypothetical protein
MRFFFWDFFFSIRLMRTAIVILLTTSIDAIAGMMGSAFAARTMSLASDSMITGASAGIVELDNEGAHTRAPTTVAQARGQVFLTRALGWRTSLGNMHCRALGRDPPTR